MIKKILSLLFVFALLSSAAFAAGIDTTNKSQSKNGTLGNDEMIGSGNGEAITTRTTEMTQTIERVRSRSMAQANVSATGDAARNVYRNQVQNAVQNMLDLSEVAGVNGQQISTIAREFNNSAQNSTQAEDRMASRGSVSRLLFGGDYAAAEDLEASVNQSQERIQEMKQLIEGDPEMDAEVKEMLLEQIATMEAEQARLQTFAQVEKQSTGLLGWLIKK
ncbi:hypothetical protein RE474_11735 [Methanolobus sediminis]|uniref:Uncharacterized protein n=1 Tax=Methanolobus sediminis TaxID=3072978 RepID=A0AA51UK36_9EURY|nr:hypothetical protein [Methanolobus sediminis]WMW24737.1 hypothetical protein RE474_11735 [Methanolobus sediminis]